MTDPNYNAIASFCVDEVRRQGHVMSLWRDGGRRVCFMLEAWYYALEMSQVRPQPNLDDIVRLAALIEPDINRMGFRTYDVRVGTRHCPAPERLSPMLNALWDNVYKVEPKQGRNKPPEPYTADDFYIEFELIHPFGDGNGRTGKILHNWLLGTLHNPVLVHDYFGGGNP